MTATSLCGCSKSEDENKSNPDDLLSITKTKYTGTQLRIDGYYYTLFNGEVQNIHFFNNNGVMSNFGACGGDISKASSHIKDPNVLATVKSNKYFLGVFIVNGADIKMEQWHPSSGGPLPAYVRAGKNLNDTTFQITEVCRMQNGQKSEAMVISELYHFKNYSPKPDSTNVFVQ